MQSFEDRERVPKIQGLLNECMTFLDDELSVITGPYEDLLSIDDVIEQELILFVTLNVNKNTEPVRALGRCCYRTCSSLWQAIRERRGAQAGEPAIVLDRVWMSSRHSDTRISARSCIRRAERTRRSCSRCRACLSCFRSAKDSRRM